MPRSHWLKLVYSLKGSVFGLVCLCSPVSMSFGHDCAYCKDLFLSLSQFYRSGSLFWMCDKHLINQWWSKSVWEHLHVFIRWNCWLKLQKLLKSQTPLKFFCKLQFGHLLQWNLVKGWWHLYKLMDRHNCMCQEWKWY